jgi:hypothetical protein
MTTTQLAQSARHLLTEAGFARVAQLVARDNEGITIELAERITDEAIKYVVTAAAHSGDKGLRPSKIVDLGWHALILHTEMYAALCAHAGRFVHHRPESQETLRWSATTMAETVAAIQAAGYSIDGELWGDTSAMSWGDCMHSECTSGGSGCAAPPQ